MAIGGTTSQGCSTTGRNDNEPFAGNHTTFNFAPQGSLAYRKAIFGLVITQPSNYTIRCQSADPLTEPVPWANFFPPDDVLHLIPIKPDGSVSGEMTDVFGGNQTAGTWKYSFTQTQ